MFDVIILDNKKEIYLSINENKIEGFNLDNGVVSDLKEEDIKVLDLFKLSLDKTYLGKENEYDVYLDNKSLFKHYFKDGIEDVKKFCEYNGTDALLYKTSNFNKNSNEYKFKTKDEKTIVMNYKTVCLLLAGITLIGSLSMLSINNGLVERLIQNNTTVTYEELKTSISNNTDLTSEEQEVFLNEKLLNDIIPYYNGSSTAYFIEHKLQSVDIIEQDKLPKKMDENTVGWYSRLENTINIVNCEYNENNESLNDTKIHEYIHLLQSKIVCLKYSYIAEASAELISYEYYNSPINSYPNEINNLKILMEIVGPEPIWKLNFSGDDTDLKNIILSNLNEEDANRLLTLLGSRDEDYAKISNNIHDEMRSLLEKLYFNIYNESVSENVFINGMYDIKDRYYFNSDLIETKQPYITHVIIRDSNEYTIGYIVDAIITYSQYLEFKDNNMVSSHIQFVVAPGYTQNNGYIVKDNEQYTIEEAYNLNILEIRIKDTVVDADASMQQFFYLNNNIPFRSATFININGEYWDINDENVKDYLNNAYSMEETKTYLPNIYETFKEESIESTDSVSF